MIKFVSFYKSVGVETKSKKMSNRLGLLNFSYEKCLGYLKNMFNFAPNDKHEFIISTDSSTDLTNLGGGHIIRDDLEGLLIMEAIVKSNTKFILNNQGKIVLAGADHLIVGPIDLFFEQEFDLAFWMFPEFDPSHKQTVSMSIVLINKTIKNSKKINSFFEEREQICFNLSKREKQWYADQKSLSLLLETRNIITDYYKFNNKDNLFNFDGLRIKLFKYGEDYMADVKDNGEFCLSSNTVLLDFPGHVSKEFLDVIYNKLIEDKN